MSHASQDGAMHEVSGSPRQYIDAGMIENTNQPRYAKKMVADGIGKSFMRVHTGGTGFTKSKGSVQR